MAHRTGWLRLDPEGYPCRIGALWTRLFLRKNWAIVVAGRVWVRDPLTWRRYMRDEFWRAHEHHHIWQEHALFKNSWSYFFAFVWQYVRHGGHDSAPLEQQANEAARSYLANKQDTLDA